MNNSISSAPKSHLNSIQTLDCRNIEAILAISKHLHTVVATTPFDDETYKLASELFLAGQDDKAHKVYRKVKFKNEQGWHRNPDSEDAIRKGFKKRCLGIYCPGSPASNTKNVVVIDIDAGGKRALKRIRKLLSLDDSNSVVTLSGKRRRFHVWVHVKDALKIVGKKIPWEAEGGSGEILYDHGVVAWNPSAELLKFLGRVRKDKIPAVDVRPLIRKSKKKVQPKNCSPKISEKIEKLVKPISKLIRPKVQKAYLVMGAAEESERNNTLNRLAMGLGAQFANQNGWRDIQKGLAKIARLKGLDDGEINSTIRSGWSAGEKAGAEKKAQGKRVQILDKILSDKVDVLCITDHAVLLAKKLKDKFLHDHIEGKWYSFGKNWSSDQAGLDLESTLTHYVSEQVSEGTLRPGRAVPGIMKPLRAEAPMRLPKETNWNPNPFQVGLPDGRVFDIKTNVIRDGKPEDYINKTLSVMPRKGSEKERKAIKKFMLHMASAYANIPGLREEIVQWLFTIRGLFYVGKADKDGKILWLYSDVGNTGKSTFIDTLLHAAGKYCAVISDDTMSQRGYQDHPQQYAVLKDKRGIVNDDAPRNAMRISMIKKIATGATIVGRHMGKENFEFVSCATMCFASNYIPVIEGDGGMQRRLAILQTQPPKKKDSKFIEYITSEKMLEVWAYHDLQGAHRAVMNPDSRDVPPSIQTKNDELLGESDVYERFVDTRFMYKKGAFTSRSMAEGAFKSAQKKYKWKEEWCLQRFRRALEKNEIYVKETRKQENKERARGFKNLFTRPE